MGRNSLIAVCIASLLVGASAALAGEPQWGVGARVGTFGVPNQILDKVLEKHPGIRGALFGAEIRYLGDGGPGGNLSVALTADAGSTEADGVWQQDPEDKPSSGRGSLEMQAVTLTVYWDLFASSPVHPFVGLGGGVAFIQGSYRDGDGDEVRIDDYLPALHLPVGIVFQLGPTVTLRAEARFIDMISLGGMLMVNF
jgi:opacity protein-like surface antigen